MNRSLPFRLNLLPTIQRAAKNRGLIFGGIILCALLSFEIFNYSSTAFALHDILGELSFGPMSWATILAIAFCGIDFAGIARIFTPETGRDEPAEVWYLFGAWLLAAGFNATLTWWGVSVAVYKHSAEGGILLGQPTMTKIVPIFVAGLVLLIRVLLINTFSIAGDRIFSLAEEGAHQQQYAQNKPMYRPVVDTNRAANNNNTVYPRPAPKPTSVNVPQAAYNEPSYHPVGMAAQSQNRNNTYTRS